MRIASTVQCSDHTKTRPRRHRTGRPDALPTKPSIIS